MDKFSRELLKIISERYNEGKPELIRSDVVRLQKKFGIGFEEAEAARKRFEKKLMDEWVNSKTKEKDSKIKNTGADNNADGAFAKIKGKVNRDIKRTIDRALKRKLSQAETQKLLKRILNGIKADAATIGRTARMGKIRSDFIIKSLQNGIIHFRFAGPTGASRTMDRARDFCLRHLGKVFSIEEILALDNGQGLPVLIYMGGYNCRHWWEAVPDSELEIENKEFDIDKIDEKLAAKITGAPEGSMIEISKRYGDPTIQIANEKIADFYCTIIKSRQGKPILYIESLGIKKTNQQMGIATDILKMQIQECRNNGFEAIKCYAMRLDEAEYNGYYTWARLGFDAELIPQEQKELEKELGKVETIQDIMKTEKGRQWWKLNGWSFDAKFDLSDNSVSMIAFSEYLKSKNR